MKTIFWENIIKNTIIFILLFLSFPNIHDFIIKSNIVADKSSVGSMLVAVGILGVIACFGNFAFTYEKIKINIASHRLLAHVTTALMMFLIGISLELTSVLSSLLIGDFQIFNISLFIVYLSSILFDFWDLTRTELKEHIIKED